MCLGLKIPDKSCFFFFQIEFQEKIFTNRRNFNGVRDFEIPVIRMGPKNKDGPIYSDPNFCLKINYRDGRILPLANFEPFWDTRKNLKNTFEVQIWLEICQASKFDQLFILFLDRNWGENKLVVPYFWGPKGGFLENIFPWKSKRSIFDIGLQSIQRQKRSCQEWSELMAVPKMVFGFCSLKIKMT